MKARVHFANTEDADMYYMVRTRIPDPFYLIEMDGKKLVFLNALEIDAFREQNSDSTIEAVPLEPLWNEAKKMEGEGGARAKLAQTLLKTYGLLGIPVHVSRSFPLDIADYLRANGVTLVVTHPFLPQRTKKTPEEIRYLRENLEHTCSAFARIEEIIHDATIDHDVLSYEGRTLTSEYIKEEVEKNMFRKGMDDVEGMIVSIGAQAAMPHHKGAGPLSPNTTIICDLFFKNRRNRYFADMTRTYVKGTPTPYVQRMYDAVCAAQDAAFRVIKPGVTSAHVYDESAKAITQAGFDVGEKGYIHGLGHGLGLELHEAPSAGAYSKEILEQGTILTVEPGLYYPLHGGVRIEDVIVVSESGCENLTNYHRNLIIE